MAAYMSSKKTLEINPTNAIMEELRKRSEVGAGGRVGGTAEGCPAVCVALRSSAEGCGCGRCSGACPAVKGPGAAWPSSMLGSRQQPCANFPSLPAHPPHPTHPAPVAARRTRATRR